jgi:hypothetical protein
MHEVLFAGRSLSAVVMMMMMVRGRELEPWSIAVSLLPVSVGFGCIVGRPSAGVRAAVRIAVSRMVEADIEPCWPQGPY